ncbi:MAG: molybdopterin-guanine dinucleotide biosynthesis protein B [Acidiferrobacterales bacterium]|nr:molybdopterin-guanine dinucleotide biosynthesis protein B [Acidiferrobacterales bacterium]
MGDRRIPIIGFAAYSGTGKTTLVTRVIPILKDRGLKVGVVKHAHHNFVIDTPGKDSYELRESGAQQVMVVSRQRIAWVMENPLEAEPDLFELLQNFSGHELDLVIVEGFKHEPFTKIEVYRSGLRRPLLAKSDENVVAVATDMPDLAEQGVETLALDDPEAIADFIIDRMRSGLLSVIE